MAISTSLTSFEIRRGEARIGGIKIGNVKKILDGAGWECRCQLTGKKESVLAGLGCRTRIEKFFREQEAEVIRRYTERNGS